MTAAGPDPADQARVTALSARYQAERATESALSGQTLVLFAAVITYGAAVAAVSAGDNVQIEDPWVLALPLPAWMALGYQALLSFRLAEHSLLARWYENELDTIQKGPAPRPEPNGLTEASKYLCRFLFYGIASALVLFGTVYCVFWGDPSRGWWTLAWTGYVFATLILMAAWWRIIQLFWKA